MTARRLLTLGLCLLMAVPPHAYADPTPYFRLNRSGPVTDNPAPPADENGNVPGTGAFKVYGPLSVRARPGLPFRVQLLADEAAGPVTWRVAGGALPPGMTLSTDGLVSGTTLVPTAFGNIVAEARNAGGEKARTYPFTVDVRPLPSVSVPGMAPVQVGSAFAIAPAPTNVYGSQTWTLSGRLPVGMSFDPNTGILRGPSQQKGDFSNFVLSVTDADGASASSAPFGFSVTSNLGVAGLASEYKVRVGKAMPAIRPYATGAEGAVAWQVAPAGAPLPSWLSFDPVKVQITGTATQPGVTDGVSFQVTDTVSGTSLASAPFKVTAAPSPTITVGSEYQYRSPDTGGLFVKITPAAHDLLGKPYWSLKGALPFGFNPNAAGNAIEGFVAGQDASASDLAFTIVDQHDGARAASNPFSIRVLPRLEIANSASVTVQVDEPLRLPPPAVSGLVGKPMLVLDGKLPDGLTPDADGGISGTPTTLGSFGGLAYTITDLKDGKSRSQQAPFAINVVPVPPFAMLAPGAGAVLAGKARQAFSYGPSVTGAKGAVSWTLAGSRPSWLGFDPATGALTGNPDEADEAQLRISATDAGTGETIGPVSFTIRVDPLDAVEVIASDKNAVAGTYFTTTPGVNNAFGGHTLSLAAGQLPPGLQIAGNAISGTPTAVGTWPGIQVKAIDRLDREDTSRAFSIVVAASPTPLPPPPPGTPTINMADIVGSVPNAVNLGPAYSNFTPVGFVLDFAPRLPLGLDFNPANGMFSGSPREAATLSGLTITARDAENNTYTTNPGFSIVIEPAPDLSVEEISPPAASTGQSYSVATIANNVFLGAQWKPTGAAPPPGLRFVVTPTGAGYAGTPTQPGVYSGLMLSVEDGLGRSAQTSAFTIAVGKGDLVVNSPAVPPGITKEPFFIPGPSFSGNVGTVSWTPVNPPPAWATVAPNGAISGTPTEKGTWSGIMLKGEDSVGAIGYTDSYSIVIKDPTIEVGGLATDYVLRVGTPFPAVIPTVARAKGAVRWQKVSGPEWLKVDGATGQLSGTPTRYEGDPNDLGEFQLKIAATDSRDVSDESDAVKVVVDPPITVAGFDEEYTVRQRAPLPLAASATGGTAPYDWTLAGPSWLAIDLLGTPPVTTVNRTPAVTAKGSPSVVGKVGASFSVKDARGFNGKGKAIRITVTEGISITGLKDPATDRYVVRAGDPIETIAPGIKNRLGAIAWRHENLPTGLGVAADGTITGKPDKAGTYSVKIIATDAADRAEATATITIKVDPKLVVSNVPSDYYVRVGKALSMPVPAIGGLLGTVTWSLVGAKPAWSTFEADLGRLVGTPAAPSADPGLLVRATDSKDGKTADSVTFGVTALGPLGIADMATLYQGRLGFDFAARAPAAVNAAPPARWSWLAGGVAPPTWLTLNPATGAMSGVPDASANTNGLVLVLSDGLGESTRSVPFDLRIYAKAEVSLASTTYLRRLGDDFSAKPTVKGVGGVGTFSLTASPGAPLSPDLTIDPANGTVSGKLVTAGDYRFAIQLVDSYDGSTVTSAPISISVRGPIALTGLGTYYAGRQGVFLITDQPYLTGAQGQVTYAISDKPPGTTLGLVTPGVLQGTPTAGFPRKEVTLTATDPWDGRKAEAGFEIYVPGPVGMTGVADAYVRNEGSFTPGPFNMGSLKATNLLEDGKVAWSLVGAPDGIAVDPDTGALVGSISGYPNGHTFPGLSLKVTDPVDGDSFTGPAFNLVVQPNIQAGVAAAPLSARVGVPKAAPTPTATNVRGTTTWQLLTRSGTAPAAVTLAADGTPSFTPDKASIGTWTYALKATDTFDGKTAETGDVTVTITDVPQFAVAEVPVHQSYGTATAQPPATGAVGTITYAATGTYPSWLAITANKVTATKPTLAPGIHGPYGFTGTDGDGAKGTGSFNISVLAPPAITGIPAAYTILARTGSPIAQDTAPGYSNPIGSVTWRLGGATSQSGGTAVTGCTANGTARGLQVGADGRLTGTPNLASGGGLMGGDACYIVEGVDAADGAAAGYKVSVKTAGPLGVAGIAPAVIVAQGRTTTYTITASNAVGTPTFAVDGLPAGFTVSGTGASRTISGDPAALGTSTATITVTDSWDKATVTQAVTFKAVPGFTASLGSEVRMRWYVGQGYRAYPKPTHTSATPVTWSMSPESPQPKPDYFTSLDPATGEFVAGNIYPWYGSGGAYKIRATNADGVIADTETFSIQFRNPAGFSGVASSYATAEGQAPAPKPIPEGVVGTAVWTWTGLPQGLSYS